MAAWALILLLLFPMPPPQSTGGIKSPEERRRAILKHDHEKSLEDIAKIRQLARELEEELEENQEHIVDVRALRKAERISNLAKDIKNRMKRLF